MADIIIHNQIMSEIKVSLNHILHSLIELSARINKPPHIPSVQPINTPTPLLSLPPPPKPTAPSSISPLKPKPTLPTSYPIKHLTYSEMQRLRDQGLCLNCNEVETLGHRCSIQRILLVLPNEEPNIEQQPMELLEPADLKTLRFQSAVLNHSVVRQMDTGITYHSLHAKIAHILGFPFDNSFAVSIAVGNDKDYVLFLRSLVECMIKMSESKVHIFDPGGISHVKQHNRSLTLRTRSFSERSVMIRIILWHQANIMVMQLICNKLAKKESVQELVTAVFLLYLHFLSLFVTILWL